MWLIGVLNTEKHNLLVSYVIRFEMNTNNFFAISNSLLCLQLAQMLRCRDLGILMLMIDNDRQTMPITLPLMYALG